MWKSIRQFGIQEKQKTKKPHKNPKPKQVNNLTQNHKENSDEIIPQRNKCIRNQRV